MSAQKEALLLQRLIAAVFLILGGWCLVSPSSVMALTVRPEFQSFEPVTMLTLAAFGSQAVLAGLFAAFSRFTRTTFAVYAIALLPYFVFNYWFYAVTPMFNELMLLDAAGNVIMLALCMRGWWILRSEGAAA